ncbi:hypothetical protein ACEWY4_017429 [Coilia grayii]|uniref:Cytoskeleton-associated protein 2 C-terminal domain-containing protein n=1 Tax=Coilia grayii TaxID=363190 RepID=A0ABD1JJ16_9TELE
MDTQKKSNKENARPKHGPQKVVTSFIKRTAPGKSAPLQSKNDQKDGTVEKRAEPTKNAEQRAPKSAVAKPAPEGKKAATLSQAFLSQQSSSYKKLLAQGPKPTSAAPPKALPGTYKGKVVQSKVDCFRKPEDPTAKVTEKRVFTKPAVPKCATLTPATLSRIKSKSVTTLPSVATQPRRPKSVTDVPLSRPAGKTTRGQPQTVSTVRQFQVTKRPVGSRPVPPVGVAKSVGGPARSIAAAVKSTSEPSQNASKPPVAPAQRPARKPVTSTLSHTRVAMETAEERRAKLAEWLASKGKTLKRPPIHSSTQPAQRTRPVSKPRGAPQENRQPQESQPAAEEQPGLVPLPAAAEPNPQAPEPETVSELSAPRVEEEEEGAGEHEGPVTSSPAPGINTTLDMVDNCSLDLPEVDTEVPMHELVVNLCEALEALEPPSTCQSDDEKGSDREHEAMGMEMQVEQEVEEEEKSDDVNEEEEEEEEVEEKLAEEKTNSEASSEEVPSEDSESEMDEDSIEGSESDSVSGEDDQPEDADVTERKVKTEVKPEEEEEEEDEEKENCGTTTPECNGASVVKFTVRTTPFLQSVKKRIDDVSSSPAAMAAPSSCGSSLRQRSRKSAAIGELKFLTPVRRSRRIERQSARLPAALADHDPCVTSLAELARLEGGGEGNEAGIGGGTPVANAYIYRRNPALLHELPDAHADLTRL